MTLQIYSTLTRDVRPFTPIHPGKVGMYVCGVTVYDYTHIGHGRTFVAFDVIRRWLQASGYEVTFVRNVTDVDDKIIRRAAEKGISTSELTEYFTRAMQEDMLALGCLAPTLRAARHAVHSAACSSLVEKLEQKGLAYAGRQTATWTFAVRQLRGLRQALWAAISTRCSAGARVEVARGQARPAWTSCSGRPPSPASRPGTRSGARGRPGWHIECSAMSRHFLGETLRHPRRRPGPGLPAPRKRNRAERGRQRQDLRQRTGCTRGRCACARPHGVGGEDEQVAGQLLDRARRAQGNQRRAIGAGNGNEVLRFFLLRSHYRSPISFNPSLIEEAHKGLLRFYSALKGKNAPRPAPVDWNEPWCARFKAAMDDDFNTPEAVSVHV